MHPWWWISCHLYVGTGRIRETSCENCCRLTLTISEESALVPVKSLSPRSVPLSSTPNTNNPLLLGMLFANAATVRSTDSGLLLIRSTERLNSTPSYSLPVIMSAMDVSATSAVCTVDILDADGMYVTLDRSYSGCHTKRPQSTDEI